MTEDTSLERILDAEVLALSPPSPREQIERATEEAKVLADIIETTRVKNPKTGRMVPALYNYIQGKKHVRVEGWTTLAALRGCIPREVSNIETDGVYVATVELVNAQGRVIGRASAECGAKGDWDDRQSYARRSMANTRATSKVCRQVFSWIMVLAGYNATPAEEVPKDGLQDAPAEKTTPKQPTERPQPQEGASEPKGVPGDWDGSKEVVFGKYSKPPEGPITWAQIPGKTSKGFSYLEYIVEKMTGTAKLMAVQEIARRALLEGEAVEVVDGQVVDDKELEERFQ